MVLSRPINAQCFKVLEGKNVEPFYKEWQGKYIYYSKGIIQHHKGEYATFMRQPFIDEPKILIRQISNEIIAAYDDEKYYLLNTLYSLLVKDKSVKTKYILAVIDLSAQNELIKKVNELIWLKRYKKQPRAMEKYIEILKDVDQWIYDIYGLSKKERKLVDSYERKDMKR